MQALTDEAAALNLLLSSQLGMKVRVQQHDDMQVVCLQACDMHVLDSMD